MCVVILRFLGGWEQFKAAFLEYRIVKFENKRTKPVPFAEILFLCMEFCIFRCLSLHVPPYSLPFWFLCVHSHPGLLTLHCHLTLLVVAGCHTAVDFPITEPPLVTNSESSPAAGPKSQLENSEIQHLKLPSEDCPKFLQLLPSSLSLPLPQPWLPAQLNRSPLAAMSTAGQHSGTTLSQSNVVSHWGLVGDRATEQPVADVNFFCLSLFPTWT